MSRARLAPLLLCLPLLAGAGTCGIILDTGSRVMIVQPVHTLEFTSDSGAIEVYAFDRSAVILGYHLTGYEASLGDIGHTVDGDVLRAFLDCDGPADCNADWDAQVPLGTAIEVILGAGDLKLASLDAPVVAVVDHGAITGDNLRSPTLDLIAGRGNIELELLSPPTALQIVLGSGDVTLTLPAGAYRCDLLTAEGAVIVDTITCDPTASATLAISVDRGDIHLEGQ